MKVHIQIKLFAGLNTVGTTTGDNYPINAGITVRQLLEEIQIPLDKVRLIFIDNVRGELDSTLKGGERVGIFPPIGGG